MPETIALASTLEEIKGHSTGINQRYLLSIAHFDINLGYIHIINNIVVVFVKKKI